MPNENVAGNARAVYEFDGTEWRMADVPDMELQPLLEFRRRLRDEATELVYRDDLSTEDAARCDLMMHHARQVDFQIDERNDAQRSVPHRPTPMLAGQRHEGLNSFGQPQQPGDVPLQQRGAPPDAETRGVLMRTVHGREIRALHRGMSMVEATAREQPDWDHRSEVPSIGRALVGMVTGNWSGAEVEKRSMLTGDGKAGGYLLSPILSASVIDLARNASSVMRAGALTVPMDSSELRIAKVVSDPTAHWRNEGAIIPASEMSFDLLTLRARTLAAFVPITMEMLEDAANAPQLIMNALQAALGLELDRAALRGDSAADEPVGLRNADGVNETTGVGVPDYDDVIDATTDILNANGMPNAWLLSPRDNGTYSKLKTTDGQYLAPPAAVSSLSRIASNQIPTNLGGGSDESEMYVGDFRQLAVGMRRRVSIEVFNDGAFVDTANKTRYAAQELKVAIRAYLRADVALIRPTHFTRLLGVTTS